MTIIIIAIIVALAAVFAFVAADRACGAALAAELVASEEADELAADLQAWLDETEDALAGPLAAVEWELAIPCRVTVVRDIESRVDAAVIAGQDAADDAYIAAMRIHGYERKAEFAAERAFERAYRAHQQSAAAKAYDVMSHRPPCHRDPYPPTYA